MSVNDFRGVAMAKSKNHTAHNQNFKAHRNGIKRPKFGKQVSTKGVSLVTLLVHLSLYPQIIGSCIVVLSVRIATRPA